VNALTFLGVAAVVIVTPGPDTALTVRNVLFAGRRSGVLTALGVACGQAAWTVATAAGVAALLAASEPAFVAVKLCGAAYLVWLGAQTLVRAFRGAAHAEDRVGHRLALRSSFRQGLISNLGNPKMAVFFTSLLPQFGRTFGDLVALGFAFGLMTFAWLSAYSVVVARAGTLLRRSRIRRTIEATTAAFLIAFGVRLAADART
jgi:threonine/homoserine/homoserine lactone efflux protein